MAYVYYNLNPSADDTGTFLLKGFVPRQGGCPCRRQRFANYLVIDFSENVKGFC